jgi:hypothetical protein
MVNADNIIARRPNLTIRAAAKGAIRPNTTIRRESAVEIVAFDHPNSV